ncbi:hypothetical protein BU23DRAFT_663728 [Bimuria novae-zelandiae CBS 107.79]|uniref:Myb-like domain-containing protein n=1 Tax=Bimuria novae-zelandiae CBS 107.79 TaxID=1447943 RepID=A0A6A5UQB5_9PLEO|nr:hypothetical protein BU23DRAFT_663728 [Bimuria novae-zelandiae CBS 107.79]
MAIWTQKKLLVTQAELEDPRLTKRRRPANRLAENLVCNPAPTPKSTPLPTPGGSASHSRASTEPSIRYLNSDRERDGARNPRSSPSDLCTKDDGGDSAHNYSERREEYREGGGGDASESHKDDDISHGPLEKTPQRQIICSCDSKCSPSPAALGHRFLGGEGEVIRMIQLSPDSWMLVGYQYNDDASGLCTRGSSSADWIDSSRSDAANHATDHSDDNWDGEDEKGEEGTEKYCQRTHTPWLESDEERLLSYKDKQGMEWMDICKRFPDRTPGAVKVRYYMLRKKVS